MDVYSGKDQQIEDFCEQYMALKSDRTILEAHLDEVARLVIPNFAGFVGSSPAENNSAGGKKHQHQQDSSAEIYLDQHASLMMSVLTPPRSQWHYLKTTNADLDADVEVRKYLEDLNRLLFTYRSIPSANFAAQNQERWISTAGFGTGCIYIDSEGPQTPLRYKNIPLCDMYMDVNHQGVPDTVFRRLWLTARQAEQKFGREMLSKEVLSQLEEPRRASTVYTEYVHVVVPNKDIQRERLDYRGKKFISVYFDVKERSRVSEMGGYRTFPYSISRYSVAPRGMYGIGPAQKALADIKELNIMTSTDRRATHLAMEPMILISEEGALALGGKFEMRPRGVAITKFVNGRAETQPLNTGSRVEISEIKMNQKREMIKDAFLISLFQILNENPRMTATEAMIRTQEKAMLISPNMGRQQSEALGTQIEREIDLLEEQGLLPERPPQLDGEDFEIVFDAPLNRMQKAEELVGVQRSIEILTPLAQIRPDVFDAIDFDKFTQKVLEVNGVPAEVMRSMEEIQGMRQQTQQMQQMQQMAATAEPVSSAVKNLAQAEKFMGELG